MSLNRLYNIFKSDRLERSDVETYGRSTDPSTQNAIEQKAMNDSFDTDAMDGWEDLSYDPSVMTQLDKKFAPTKGVSLLKILGGTTIIATVIITILYITVFQEDSKPPLAQQTNDKTELPPTSTQTIIVLDESDVSLPGPIEQMNHVPKADQVQPKQISKEFQEIITFRIETSQLPIKKLPNENPIPTPTPEIARNHKEAKEIYLHSMKLVDYRKYREKPQIKTKQLTLSGTPANKEDEYSKDEDPVWRDVDVPYIDYIDKSVNIFERGNYKKALTRFETILETYPDDVNANFYAGICLFNLGEYSKAINNFSACVNGPYSNFDEEAQWMMAESYSKIGDSVKAKALYRIIANGSGYYAAQAKDKLK